MVCDVRLLCSFIVRCRPTVLVSVERFTEKVHRINISISTLTTGLFLCDDTPSLKHVALCIVNYGIIFHINFFEKFKQCVRLLAVSDEQ